MKNGVKLFIVLAAVLAGGYVYSSRSTTYSGQCGPIIFDYARLGFSLTGNVSSVEKSGTKISVSGVPCIYQEDK